MGIFRKLQPRGVSTGGQFAGNEHDGAKSPLAIFVHLTHDPEPGMPSEQDIYDARDRKIEGWLASDAKWQEIVGRSVNDNPKLRAKVESELRKRTDPEMQAFVPGSGSEYEQVIDEACAHAKREKDVRAFEAGISDPERDAAYDEIWEMENPPLNTTSRHTIDQKIREAAGSPSMVSFLERVKRNRGRGLNRARVDMMTSKGQDL